LLYLTEPYQAVWYALQDDREFSVYLLNNFLYVLPAMRKPDHLLSQPKNQIFIE